MPARKTLLLLATITFASLSCLGQSPVQFTGYGQAQISATLDDYTVSNNPWGAGAGFTALLKNRSSFSPLLECSASLYPGGNKVLRENPDGSYTNNKVESVVYLLAGVRYHAGNTVFLSLAGGTAFISGQTRWTLKPGIGLFFSTSQRWSAQLSYINVFNRVSHYNFSTVSLSVGRRLF